MHGGSWTRCLICTLNWSPADLCIRRVGTPPSSGGHYNLSQQHDACMLLWRREPEKVERDAEDVRKDLERLEMIRKKRCAGEDFALVELNDDSWEKGPCPFSVFSDGRIRP